MGKKNQFIEDMISMASNGEDEYGMPKFDEQKLRRELEKNDKLGLMNRQIYAQKEPKYHTCPRYNPCPICDKCTAKCSHLYVSCQTCQIETCAHDFKKRKTMIRRENFTQYVTQDVMDSIEALAKEITND